MGAFGQPAGGGGPDGLARAAARKDAHMAARNRDDTDLETHPSPIVQHYLDVLFRKD